MLAAERCRSSHLEVFQGKVALKICSKFTGEHPCRSAISITLQSNFTKITFWHGCSPVNLLHIFRTLSSKSTSGWLLLSLVQGELKIKLLINFVCNKNTKILIKICNVQTFDICFRQNTPIIRLIFEASYFFRRRMSE